MLNLNTNHGVGIYRKSDFFTDDIDFSIDKFVHTPSEYNKEVLHTREFLKIIYVISGRGKKIVNGVEFHLQPGSLFLILPEDITAYEISSEKIEIYNILFTPPFISEAIKRMSDNFGFFSSMFINSSSSVRLSDVLYITKSNKEIAHLVTKLYDEYAGRQRNYKALLRLYLSELLLIMERMYKPKKGVRSAQVLSAYIQHIIDEHFTEDFNLDYLAQNIGVSKHHLCRVFQEQTGTTIISSLKNRRILHAKALLLESDLAITLICYECGFNDLSYFYRSFKELNGVNPGQYRQNHSAGLNE